MTCIQWLANGWWRESRLEMVNGQSPVSLSGCGLSPRLSEGVGIQEVLPGRLRRYLWLWLSQLALDQHCRTKCQNVDRDWRIAGPKSRNQETEFFPNRLFLLVRARLRHGGRRDRRANIRALGTGTIDFACRNCGRRCRRVHHRILVDFRADTS